MIAAYLEAAIEHGDAALLTHALGVIVPAKGMSPIATESGVTWEALGLRLCILAA